MKFRQWMRPEQRLEVGEWTKDGKSINTVKWMKVWEWTKVELWMTVEEWMNVEQ